MSSAAQITANLNNAKSSTGPRTEAGKQTSSRNAFKYGVTSKQVVLSTEDPAEFDAVHQAHIDEFKPATFLENWYVDEIVSNEWRRRRVESAQKAWLEQQAKQHIDMTETIFTKQLATFHRYESAYRRAAESAHKKLKALQRERRAAEAMQPQTAEQSPTTPAKLRNEANSRTPEPAIVKAIGAFDNMLTPEYTAKMVADPIYSFVTKSSVGRR